MRRLTIVLTILTFSGLMLVGCGGDSSTGPDPNHGDNGGNSGNETTTYSVDMTPAPSEGGSVSASADDPYEEGESIELTAEASDEYRFTHWSGDVDSTADNPLSITVDQDYSLTANFAIKNYELTINTEGEGSVAENVVQVKEYESGTQVELVATPAEGWRFVEWTGDLSGTDNPVRVTVDSPKEVTAVFEKKSYELTVNTQGEGAIVEQVVQQSKDYEHGTVVELTANPATGWEFVEWQGAINGTDNPQQITVDEAKEVTAVFEKKSYPLTINTTGNGFVTNTPDQQTYRYGTTVELLVNAVTGWTFTGWQGDLTGSDNPEEITVNEAKEVTAVFEKKTYALTINTTGNGSVTKTPDQSTYEHGTVVDLTVNPAADWEFVEWQGDLGGSSNQNQITMDGPKDVTAEFINPSFYLASNGVTVKCETAGIGETGIVNGTIYTKRSKSQITIGNASQTCTSGITDMSNLFEGASSFNGDISHWDVSSVTDMRRMFFDAHVFNRDLSNWDVGSVTDMQSMFSGADIFNGNISSWDVISVTTMRNMFYNADAFDQDLNSWNVENVTDMGAMFYQTDNFNGDISGWDVGNVTEMASMFRFAGQFNGDLSNWDVSSVSSMNWMFRGASSFNQDISTWCVQQIASEPTDFDTGAGFDANDDENDPNFSKLPKWGESAPCSGS